MRYEIKNGSIAIRPMQHTDVDALVGLATASFTKEFEARGMTPESLTKQARILVRGYMIPFKLIKKISGFKLEIFVAEYEGKVIACAIYSGKQQAQLSNLMVAPDYRRKGVGEALLKYRLALIKAQGYSWVTTTILQNNEASLGNVTKQGFKPFEHFVTLEKTVSQNGYMALGSQPVQENDKPIFQAMESAHVAPERLKLLGSAVDAYFPTFGNRLMSRLDKNISQQWLFFDRELTVGFLTAFTSPYQTKGTIGRPITTNPDYIPAMLAKGEAWLAGLGKTAVRVTISRNNPELLTQLQSKGWVMQNTWVRLVKYF